MQAGDAALVSPLMNQPKLNILDFGAYNDGSQDNSSIIEMALQEAEKQKLPLYFPKGQYNYSRVIRLNSVKIFGDGEETVFYALDYNNEAIFMFGENSEVSFLKLTGEKSENRLAAWEATRITLFGAKNFLIDHVKIESSAAAGIQTAQMAENGQISNCKINGTLADGIHITDKSSYIQIKNNEIENAGDDGIAVVSYQNDQGFVHDIVAVNNIIKNNNWGRLMSVVGGQNILYQNNLLDSNLTGAACIYLGQEDSYKTYTINNIKIDHNTLINCGSLEIGHGAIMVVNDSSEYNSQVQITNNDLILNNQPGIRILSLKNEQFNIQNNKIRNSSIDYDIQTSGIQIIPFLEGELNGDVGYQP